MKNPTASLSIGLRVSCAVGLSLATFLSFPASSGDTRERDHTLKLYFGHTGERGEFTFKRNGRYDRRELERINQFLRDWRKDEPTRMDPNLLDLVWAIYQETGSDDYVHVVSAYRSLTTNNLLRSRSRGVAKHSQHTLGKAMDFYLPDVPLAKLRATAMKMQGGGVGYYPTSGSPFVHVDTGNVRSWPRMTRQQLLALFPNGETLYLPTDGKPLPGYERALARRKSGGETALAYLETGDDETAANDSGSGGWLKRVFAGGKDRAEVNAATAQANAPTPDLAPVVAPPTGDSQILIASEVDPGARMPKARPGMQPEALVALIDTELREDVVATEDPLGMASLAFAPLPRSRPNLTVLAESLDHASGQPAALAVDAEDAIAALAAQSEALVPAPAPAEPVQVRMASTQAEQTDSVALTSLAAATDESPSSSGESAMTVLAAIDQVEPAPVPKGRPLVMAFAGAELRWDTKASAAEPAAIQQRSTDERVGIGAEPSYGIDASALRQLIATAAIGNREFDGLAMPQPVGAPGLYTPPDSSSDVAEQAEPASLPTDHFRVAEVEESFLSKLFASLAQ